MRLGASAPSLVTSFILCHAVVVQHSTACLCVPQGTGHAPWGFNSQCKPKLSCGHVLRPNCTAACRFPDLQVKDQSYEYPDNAALVRNCESSTPVRVFRGQKAKNKGEYPVYAYEGLYTITGHRMEPSADGPLVSAGVQPAACTMLCCSAVVLLFACGMLCCDLRLPCSKGLTGRPPPANKTVSCTLLRTCAVSCLSCIETSPCNKATSPHSLTATPVCLSPQLPPISPFSCACCLRFCTACAFVSPAPLYRLRLWTACR